MFRAHDVPACGVTPVGTLVRRGTGKELQGRTVHAEHQAATRVAYGGRTGQVRAGRPTAGTGDNGLETGRPAEIARGASRCERSRRRTIRARAPAAAARRRKAAR